MNSFSTTSLSSDGGRTHYTPRQAARALGIEQWRVHRAIQRGVLRTQRRRSQLVIPATELARLLGGAR